MLDRLIRWHLIILICFSITTLFVATTASAETNPYPLKVGALFDVSVPSGVALGLDVRLPYVPYVKLGVAGTYTLAPGIRGSLLIDPIKFSIVPLANIDIGYQSQFKIPNISNSPSFGFKYIGLQGGFGFGNRDGFRFMLLAGMSYLSGEVANYQAFLADKKGISIGTPTFNGWVPNAKIGFNFLF